MARALALVICLMSLTLVGTGCGRSDMLGDDVVDVSVGLTGINGLRLTEAQVAYSLGKLGFTLLSFDDAAICDASSGCFHAADGALPAAKLNELQAFEDGALRVVFVEQLDSAPPASLPDRN